MKDVLIYISLIVIGIVIGFIIHKSPTPKTITKIEIEYKDTGSYHIRLVPEPYKVDSFIYMTDSVWLNVDTAAMVSQYLSRIYYSDTIVNDSSLTVSYAAIVQYNRIDSISFDYSNNRATKIVTNTTNILPSPKFGLGVLVEGNSKSFDVSPIAMYHLPKISLIGGYGIMNKTAKVGVVFNF